MPIQTDNMMEVHSKQELIAAVGAVEYGPTTIVLHRQGGGLTIYHFSYSTEFLHGHGVTIAERIANIQKQIRKIPRQAFV